MLEDESDTSVRPYDYAGPLAEWNLTQTAHFLKKWRGTIQKNVGLPLPRIAIRHVWKSGQQADTFKLQKLFRSP